MKSVFEMWMHVSVSYKSDNVSSVKLSTCEVILKLILKVKRRHGERTPRLGVFPAFLKDLGSVPSFHIW